MADAGTGAEKALVQCHTPYSAPGSGLPGLVHRGQGRRGRGSATPPGLLLLGAGMERTAAGGPRARPYPVVAPQLMQAEGASATAQVLVKEAQLAVACSGRQHSSSRPGEQGCGVPKMPSLSCRVARGTEAGLSWPPAQGRYSVWSSPLQQEAGGGTPRVHRCGRSAACSS